MEQLCKQCACSFKIKRSKILPTGNFCSNKCRGTWLKENPNKNNSPFKLGHKGFRHRPYSSTPSSVRKKISDKLTGKPRPNRETGGWNKCKTCKKKIYIQPSRVKRKYCSRRCLSFFTIRKTGQHHRNWKGGITPKNIVIRNSEEYKLWRKSVFERDKYTCMMPGCGKSNVYLNAHHIRTFEKYEELRLVVLNGITLCQACHNKTKKREEQFEDLFDKILKNGTKSSETIRVIQETDSSF